MVSCFSKNKNVKLFFKFESTESLNPMLRWHRSIRPVRGLARGRTGLPVVVYVLCVRDACMHVHALIPFESNSARRTDGHKPWPIGC